MFVRLVNVGEAEVAFKDLLFAAPNPPNNTISSGLFGFTAIPSTLTVLIFVAVVAVGGILNVCPV